MPFAPRPHTELVYVRDLTAETMTLPGADRPARLITLSRSPLNGAISAVVILPPGWRRTAGSNPLTFSEFFLLSGDLQLGDHLLQPWHYLRLAKGANPGAWQTTHGARLLWFTNDDPLAWELSRPGEQGVLHVDTNVLEWTLPFVPGSNVTRTGARLLIKLLYRDPDEGGYTRLVRQLPGWEEPRLEHHLCTEEAYGLVGISTYNFGVAPADSYFWRPPRIQHGNFRAGESGKIGLTRTDGPLENLYSTLEGEPLNWEPGSGRDPIPVEEVRPIRSPSGGPLPPQPHARAQLREQR
ncbi:MAG: hypothetical protein KatS3mg061_2099 [Dehalococcoidia bacterium]|nr:MAG: hypothetical protein KatS3mg061_2099 [Dehalococcoidia bacterium]